MLAIDSDSAIRIWGGVAIVCAAVVTVILGLYAQLRIKRFELRAQAKRDRAAQRLTYYLPLLRFCYEFDGRIGRILDSLSTDWLSRGYLEKIRRGEGFAQSPLETGYFIMSSTYVFACFFGWTEAIKKGIDTTEAYAGRSWLASHWEVARRYLGRTVFRGTPTGTIFFFEPEISMVRRLFQYQELFTEYALAESLTHPRDASKLHRHLQHSIGEMMLQSTSGGESFRCKTFREFADAYREEDFRYWFIPLEELIVDLCGFPQDQDLESQVREMNDMRPLRLLAIRYWARVLMRNLSKELGISTPPPDDVVRGVSSTLRQTITSVRIEQLEAHLSGAGLGAK